MAINFNQIADDFRHTNWKDPGTWTLGPMLLVLVAILAALPIAGWLLLWQDQWDQLEKDRNAEKQLKEDYLNKKKQAVNLDLHKQQLREIDTQFGALLKQLPNKAQMDALLVDINQAGLSRGLLFELFKPEAESVKEFYAELPIKIKVTGGYHDMGNFAADLGQLSRIVTLNDVAIEAAKDGTLTMDATARTFRYLDDDEVAAQRKAASKKAPGKK
jgi:type IV pilus assembly protein PilO